MSTWVLRTRGAGHSRAACGEFDSSFLFGYTFITKSSGGQSEAVPPVPIPNTEVKRFSADDTKEGTPWENMPLPEGFLFYHQIPAFNSCKSLFICFDLTLCSTYNSYVELVSALITDLTTRGKYGKQI